MLSIDFTFLFTALNLVVLFLFLRHFLFGRVTKFMDERAAGIAADMDAAKKDKAEAAQYVQQQQDLLREAAQEHARMLDDARKRADAQYDEKIKEARAAATRIVQRAEARAKNKSATLDGTMRDEVASIALEAASRAMEENMDSEKNRKLVDAFLKEGQEREKAVTQHPDAGGEGEG